MNNRKGYALIEIILASLIGFGILAFIVYLTISIKNKNDDEFVETQVMTDRDIVTNKIVEYAMTEMEQFDCNQLAKNNNTITYKGNVIDIINEYATLGDITCSNDKGVIEIEIPLSVRQMADKDYDIKVSYKYEIEDVMPPTCTLELVFEKAGESVESGPWDKYYVRFAERKDNLGVVAYGIDKPRKEPKLVVNYDNIESIELQDIGTYNGFVKDAAGNEGMCQIEVKIPGTYTKTTTPCVDVTPSECWREDSYDSKTGKRLTCRDGEVACTKTTGCCLKGSYTADKCSKISGYQPRKTEQNKYAFGATTVEEKLNSCTPQNTNMICDKKSRNKSKIECAPDCSEGYTLVGYNYCYRVVAE